MGTDRKAEYTIKFILIVSLIGYILCHFTFKFYLYKKEVIDKSVSIPYLLTENNISILGGSNAVLGISSQILTQSGLTSSNYSMPTELNNFNNYTNWLRLVQLKAKVAVYSPMDIWSEKKLEDKPLDSINSIAKFMRYKFFYDGRENNNFDSFGDLINYSCPDSITATSINKSLFNKYTNENVNYIVSHMRKLKEQFGFEKIYLRVPPRYFTGAEVHDYQGLLNARLALISKAGFEIVNPENYLNSDPTLFCDATHPSKKGRTYFTKQLIVFLDKQDYEDHNSDVLSVK